jgi:uncharacterized protein (TIGR03118 family)
MVSLFRVARKVLLAGGTLAIVIGALAARDLKAQSFAGRRVVELKLVSDVTGLGAFHTDSNLLNPWGIAAFDSGPFWISDNHAGASTLYQSFGQAVPLVVNIPAPGGASPGSPTGIVFNPNTRTKPLEFVVTGNGKSGPSVFIFATEDGAIVGWNPSVDRQNGVIAFDNSASGAVYKGLALASYGGHGYLYGANFNSGWVDMLDENFHWVNSFTDPGVPAGFAPFGIQKIYDHLYVTYAKQDIFKHDDVSGPGNGYVSVFNLDGTFNKRLITGGFLNSPWGLALAPQSWGASNGYGALLVGNFGDGKINAFGFTDGHHLGQVKDYYGNPLVINGLWGLMFGNGRAAGVLDNWLYFTAGPGGEAHGLFGALIPQPPATP